MTLVDIHHKYLEVTLITYENIQKANWVIFFDLTVMDKGDKVVRTTEKRGGGKTFKILDFIFELK